MSAKKKLRQNQSLAKPHSMVYKTKTSPMLEYNKKKMEESHKKYTQFIEQGKKNANKIKLVSHVMPKDWNKPQIGKIGAGKIAAVVAQASKRTLK